MKIKISEIIADPKLQSRQGMDSAVVAEYAEAMRGGAVFPPIVVFAAADIVWSYVLADGFHRHAATVEAGFSEIEAEVRIGGRREALLYSLGANASHGLRRTNEDKRKAVETLLLDPEWAKWSDREIARHANVSAPMVGKIRSEMPTVKVYSCGTPTGEIPSSRLGADGKLRAIPKRPAGRQVRGPALDGLIEKTLRDLFAQVPDDKLHYVAHAVAGKAWEVDPEGQERQVRELAEDRRKAKKK